MMITMNCRHSLIVCGCAAAAAGIAVDAAPSHSLGGVTRRTAFVHHGRPQSSGQRVGTSQRNSLSLRSITKQPLSNSKVVLHATKDDDSIDPLDMVYDDDSTVLPSPSSSWDVADDWSSLTSSNAAAAAAASFTSSSAMDGSYDPMVEAARILEEQEQIVSEWDGSEDNDESTINSDSEKYVKSSVDDFVEDAVEMIASNSDYHEPDGVQLYDTITSSSTKDKTASDDKIKQQDDARQEEEIAFMIRCNQSPEQLLISQGKALPELTDEIKYPPEFLLLERQRMDDGPRLPLQPRATLFFEQAVKKIFDTYSVVNQSQESQGLDRDALSKWMTTCISSPLTSSSNEEDTPKFEIGRKGVVFKKDSRIGPYDQSVSAILSRYSQSHGSGRLTLEEFQTLYLEVAWGGYIRDIVNKKTELEEGYKIPSVDVGVIIEGRKNTEKMLKQASLSLVWRDLEAHEVFSPAEEEHVRLLQEMERVQASSLTSTSASSGQLLMDECELFDDYSDRISHQISHSLDNDDDDLLGTEQTERREKGSHELVEMTSVDGGKTPKRIRDGELVFIDEESCIGCTQCAVIAPSTFKMIEESGRARTYQQSSSLDVENAVMACPVSCMHYMSYDELKEMEVSRDDGDGRTDHRHFGAGRSHTPLSVAGIDSDANHKSSWYHYLKWKCHGSATCPQRGCYDCPTYAPGENPFFRERFKQDELTRAKDFMQTGEADKWRKVVEL